MGESTCNIPRAGEICCKGICRPYNTAAQFLQRGSSAVSAFHPGPWGPPLVHRPEGTACSYRLRSGVPYYVNFLNILYDIVLWW